MRVLKPMGVGLGLVLLVLVTVLIAFPIQSFHLLDALLTGRVAYDLDEGLLAYRYISQGRDDLVAGFVFSWLIFIVSAFVWWHILSRLVSGLA